MLGRRTPHSTRRLRRWLHAGATALLVLGAQAGFTGTALTQHQRSIENAGSLLQYGVPATALLATWLLDKQAFDATEAAQDEGEPDPPAHPVLLMGGSPRHDLALALGRAWLATETLKFAMNETRPNGGPRSFPSGHTSIAFAGAEFIRKEYGWGWATPAYLAAGFVGWSRVQAKKHFIHDVAAGALVGILANHDFWRWKGTGSEFAFVPLSMDTNGKLVPGVQFELDF